jgi:serine/threonine protein kinase
MTGNVGNLMFMAPEVFKYELYDYSVDVFAFALLIYTLFEPLKQMDDGNPFPKTPQQVGIRIDRGVRYRRPKGIPDAFVATRD